MDAKTVAKEAAEVIATMQARKERVLTEREIYNIIRDTVKRQTGSPKGQEGQQ